jgi:hypothetical protein
MQGPKLAIGKDTDANHQHAVIDGQLPPEVVEIRFRGSRTGATKPDGTFVEPETPDSHENAPAWKALFRSSTRPGAPYFVQAQVRIEGGEFGSPGPTLQIDPTPASAVA